MAWLRRRATLRRLLTVLMARLLTLGLSWVVLRALLAVWTRLVRLPVGRLARSGWGLTIRLSLAPGAMCLGFVAMFGVWAGILIRRVVPASWASLMAVRSVRRPAILVGCIGSCVMGLPLWRVTLGRSGRWRRVLSS